MSRTAPETTAADSWGLRKPLRVLLVEDSQPEAELCLRELKKAGFKVCTDLVQTPEEFSERLRANTYDIVLADYRLPGWTGLEAMQLLRQLGQDIPFLLVTGTLGEEAAVECIKQGVTEYVLKDRLARLPVAVQRALEEKALREERTRAERALRESEASFRLLFANNPLPMWVFDGETLQFLQVNDAAIAHYGYSREEFLGMRITDICPPEDVAPLSPAVEKERPALRLAGQWRHRTKEGRILDVEIITHALEFAGRGAILVVAQDITERKRAEAENARLITAIEQSAEGVLITDRLGRIQYTNPALTRISGYSREEMIGQDPRLFRSGQHDWPFYEHLWKTILAGETWRGEIINRRKDGSFYTEEMSITPVRDQHGGISHFIAIKQDVTERKRAEEALRQSEARHRELVKNATYAIYRTNPEGKFLDVNLALVAMLGYSSEEELLSVNLATDVYRDPAARAQLLEQTADPDRVNGVEVEWKCKDGRPILVRLSGRTVRDAQGNRPYFEGIAEDVTERRALEKQLRQVQKFEAIGQLAGGIAHDFNNVIGAIMGWAELGQEQTPADSRLHSHFKKIKQQADRAAGLTRQLLAFARRQILEPQNVHLNQTIAELLSLLEKVISKDIELKTVLAPNLGVVRADPTQLEQVLMNLCLNARDAMPRGGQLLIETQNVEIDQEYSRSHAYARMGQYVMLSVTDNGIGMDATTMEHIFEPFFTTKEPGKGTGLGLATVYGVVKQHGGFLHVYSEPGRGSTFHVYFPIQSRAPTEEERKEKEREKEKAKLAAEPVRGGTETILVAEDHEDVREMARMTLESLGYRVILAEDGEKAVGTFEECRDRIALVVLDMIMPKLGAQEVYARMCAAKPDVAVLLTTGYSAEADSLSEMMKKGIAVLQKPYAPSLLARKVREVLDRPVKVAPGPIRSSRR